LTTATRGAVTAERLILVAEQLYADHGLDAVSFRQIAEAAGQKNHAVVQYHFGTKEELLKAIVLYRTEDAKNARTHALDQLVATGRQHDIRALLEATLEPLVAAGPSYMRFVVALRPHGLADIWGEIDESHAAVTRRLGTYLDEALEHVPVELRRARTRRAFDMMLRALAEHYGAPGPSPTSRVPDDLFLDDLVISGAAALEAPLPPRSVQRLRSAGAAKD
jgi:AcrR family transcriptional regulator